MSHLPVNYAMLALSHLESAYSKNQATLKKVTEGLIQLVPKEKCLLAFGSGHSALVPLEIYHRAGGASFVIPLVSNSLLPSSGPRWVRALERTQGVSPLLLDQVDPKPGEMLWIFSQSGINSASVDLALEAKRRKLRTVAFTSLEHSKSVSSRHSSGKKLYQVCSEVIDLGGARGDAILSSKKSRGLSVGPVSTLTGIFLAHSILSEALMVLEEKGIRCTYTSVNTPEGEKRNQKLEQKMKQRDSLLR